jgi:HEAT repeat protein
LIDQAEIHRKCAIGNLEERKIVINQLRDNFEKLPNKKQAWEDLYRSISDGNSVVQWMAVTALEVTFQHVPDKKQAWQDLIKLTLDENKAIKIGAVTTLGAVFQFLPDKEHAWEDLHKLTSDKDSDIRYLLTEVIGSIFEQISHKREAWEDLHRLTLDKDHRVRNQTALALKIAFQFIPEKEEAWEDLIKLTSDEESWVRWDSADALKTVLHYVPNKENVLKDLRKLASDKDYLVRSEAILAQGAAFRYEPEKKKAWGEFCRLTSNENSNVGNAATKALGISFLYVPDKKQAWEDLHRLIFDKNSDIRNGAACALGTAFQHVPDTKQAWEDLHRLTLDEDSWVRNGATWAIGSVFQYLPEKQIVYDDLRRLSLDEDYDVQIIACHFLGRVSVYKASRSSSEGEYMRELENSITFFENSYEINSDNNPSGFCLPFYRSFYTIIKAEKQQTKDEVRKYLAEAKSAIRGSKNKKLLLEAVENLARALEEVQDQKNIKLEAKIEKLDFYRKYCEKAAELMINTEEMAPSATRVLRKGLPILDRKLKSLLEEIQEKAKTACRESKGTDTEEITCAVSREVQKWEIGSQEEMTWNIENLIFALESSIPRLPTNQHIFDRIQEIREQKDIPKQCGMVSVLITLIPKLCMEQKIDSIEKKLDDIIIHFSESHTDLTISLGADFYGNGMKVTKTIPLQKFSDTEKGEIEGKIQGNKGIKLSSLSATLVNKIKGHLFLTSDFDSTL